MFHPSLKNTDNIASKLITPPCEILIRVTRNEKGDIAFKCGPLLQNELVHPVNAEDHMLARQLAERTRKMPGTQLLVHDIPLFDFVRKKIKITEF